MASRVRPPSRSPELFTFDDTSLQVHWGSLPEGRITVTTEPPTPPRVIEHCGGAGAITLDGLTPSTEYRVTVTQLRRGTDETVGRITARTATPPPGDELYRIATVNDLHLGRERFGVLSTMREHDADVPHPQRCLEAAVDEALAWGAQHIVVKGDITDAGHHDAWATAGRIFRTAPVPVDLICGNHDVAHGPTIDPFEAAAVEGLRLHPDVAALDVPGLRVVLMDSSVPGVDIGRWLPHAEASCDAVAEASHVLFLTHHQPQPLSVPTYLPIGIPRRAALEFARGLHRANPGVVASSGHTHRNRLYRLGDVQWGEVGSTKDYPGVWSGYVVYEGGISQTIRRIERDDCIQWTEYTKRAAGTAWGMWAPGRVSDRVLSRQWARDRINSN